MSGTFTGRHMAAILVGFFGIVVTVNFTMASYARSTFGGIVVENSYVASEKFNGWLARAGEQQALGWSAAASRRGDGRVELAVEAPASVVATGTARHPLGRMPDRALAFERTGAGFLSRETLPEGRWIVRIELADGTDRWAHEEHLQ